MFGEGGMGYKVLIVDDSKLARMAVVRALVSVRPDWSRVEAASAEEAIAALKEANPDLVILDYNMPGRDGLDVAVELLSIRPSMPIALISANHQREVVSRAEAMGMAFLEKPLTELALKEFLTGANSRLDARG
jgi:CheY-like chemotaxis protein